MAETKLSQIIATSLSQIREVVDANTIIGEPIQPDNGSGTVIIPVSKISVGFASGGIDYFGKNVPADDKLANFGGGGGTGMTVNPVGFIIIKADGGVEMLNVNSSSDTGDAIAAFIEKSPEIFDKIKSFFKKNKKSDDDDDDINNNNDGDEE